MTLPHTTTSRLAIPPCCAVLAPSGGISLDDPSITPNVHTKRFGPDGPTGRRPRLAFHAERPTDSGVAERGAFEHGQTSHLQESSRTGPPLPTEQVRGAHGHHAAIDGTCACC